MEGPTATTILLFVQQLQFSVLDDVGEVLIDVFEASAEAHFHSETEPFLQFPHDLWQNKALEGGFSGAIERKREAVFWKSN